jgi:hypothetical protein
MNRDQIKEIFLRNGFAIKDGATDLADYVYAAATEVHRMSYWDGYRIGREDEESGKLKEKNHE